MNLAALVEQGNVQPLFLLGAALLLGALHALEPGHSKTMMVAFIVAVRGTIAQAALLGGSAAFSHTLVVWLLALLALTYGNEMIAEDMEPWLMVISGLIILGIALWMTSRIYRNRRPARDHEHPHQHDHSHAHEHPHERADHHVHHHANDHDHSRGSEDAHARAHAEQIERQFSSGRASTGQVVWFGLTGGLVPCPAAVTILILCLHLQQFWLGAGIVGAFSVGLALTLIAIGVAAAWGVAVSRRRSSRFEGLFAAAPYISVLLIATLGIIMLVSGFHHLGHVGHA
jgi:ABC-type nickel/cobalt efflux system permease component RcnA